MSSKLLELFDFEEEPQDKTVKGYRRRFTKYDPESPEQEKDETPPLATEALLLHETFEGSILEPFAGRGGITKVLQAQGYKVTSRDLIPKGEGIEQSDFFTIPAKERWGNVIGAPPFKIAAPLAYQALQHAHRKVALLLRGTFLENRNRYNLLFKNPELPYFEKVYVFIDRLPYGEGNMIMYAWFIWNKQFQGTDPTVHWL